MKFRVLILSLLLLFASYLFYFNLRLQKLERDIEKIVEIQKTSLKIDREIIKILQDSQKEKRKIEINVIDERLAKDIVKKFIRLNIGKGGEK